MKIPLLAALSLAAAFAAQDPAASAQQGSEAAPDEEPTATPPDPFPGSYPRAMQRVRELAGVENHTEARGLARSLLSETFTDRLRTRVEGWTSGAARPVFDALLGPLGWLGLPSLSDPQRAEVHYTVATLSLALGEVDVAVDSFVEAAVPGRPGPDAARCALRFGLDRARHRGGCDRIDSVRLLRVERSRTTNRIRSDSAVGRFAPR